MSMKLLTLNQNFETGGFCSYGDFAIHVFYLKLQQTFRAKIANPRILPIKIVEAHLEIITKAVVRGRLHHGCAAVIFLKYNYN